MTRDDVIQALLAEPDNDEPRLILADWLEENGVSDGLAVSVAHASGSDRHN